MFFNYKYYKYGTYKTVAGIFGLFFGMIIGEVLVLINNNDEINNDEINNNDGI